MKNDSKTLLLVDDSNLVLQMEKSVLGKESYRFLEAQNGEEALEKAKKHKPDLILLDLILPGMDGDEVCKRIREDDEISDISIIMVTVSGQEAQKEECYKAGCNDYITKPLDPGELKYKIEKLLNIAERVTYRVLVKIDSRDDESDFIFGNTVNISESGLKVESQKELEVDSKVDMDFYLTAPVRNIRAKGKVVRKEESGLRKATGYGIEFTEMSEEAREEIREMIKNKVHREK